MSTNEIALASQVKQEQNKKKAQLLAWTIYNVATLMVATVNEPKKFPELEDAFPSQFEKETKHDWRIMKERMEVFTKAKRVDYG